MRNPGPSIPFPVVQDDGAAAVTAPARQDDGEARLMTLPCRVPAHGFGLVAGEHELQEHP